MGVARLWQSWSMVQRISSPDVVGRGRELRELVAHLEESRSGTTPLVVLAGEAGLGKSRPLTAAYWSAFEHLDRVLELWSEIDGSTPRRRNQWPTSIVVSLGNVQLRPINRLPRRADPVAAGVDLRSVTTCPHLRQPPAVGPARQPRPKVQEGASAHPTRERGPDRRSMMRGSPLSLKRPGPQGVDSRTCHGRPRTGA